MLPAVLQCRTNQFKIHMWSFCPEHISHAKVRLVPTGAEPRGDAVSLSRHLPQPIKSRVRCASLMPDDFLRKRLSSKLRHPIDCYGVVALHPVTVLGVNDDFVCVAVRIFGFQLCEPFFPFDRLLVSVVGCVLSTHVQGESDVPKPECGYSIGMTRHHGSSSQLIGQPSYARGATGNGLTTSGRRSRLSCS